MNERLPYEDSMSEGLNDLPLPDENRSWRQMEKLLDEEDRDRVVPPVLLRGCLGWALLLVAVVGVLWLVLRPQRWWKGHEATSSSSSARPRPLPGDAHTGDTARIPTGARAGGDTLTKGGWSSGEPENTVVTPSRKAGIDTGSADGSGSSVSTGGAKNPDGTATSTTGLHEHDSRPDGKPLKPGGVDHKNSAPIPGSSEAAGLVMPGARPPAAHRKDGTAIGKTASNHSVSNRRRTDSRTATLSKRSASSYVHHRDTGKKQRDTRIAKKPVSTTTPVASHSSRRPSTSQRPSTARSHPVSKDSLQTPSSSSDNPSNTATTQAGNSGVPATSSNSSSRSTTDSSKASIATATGKPASTAKPAPSPSQVDSTKKTTPSSAQADKKTTKGRYYISTGIGLQQQIPIAGQKPVPYNYYGRKGSLADYIPSIYLRLHRARATDRWYVQGEFRYGAPQSLKQLTYSSVSRRDSGQVFGTVTQNSVKKTFYHQIPLSFNYYVLPNWSVGAGLMYSRFRGAIAEQRIDRINQATGADSIVSLKTIKVPANTDSFFTRSQVHALVQTEYGWRRLSLSLRYTKGLQPFIRYTDPAGVPKQQKAQAFEALLRFRLWRSGKK